MKKFFSILLSLTFTLITFTGCTSLAPTSSAPIQSSTAQSQTVSLPQSSSLALSPAPRTTMKIASLKGPTTIGLVKLMSEVEDGTARHDYNVTMYGSADEIAPQLIKGDIDIAYVPCNLASILYNKTEGQIQVAAINTLGVLYIVQLGDEVKTVADLKGRTIYSTGKGTTPEYVLNYILQQNGLEIGKDVTIEYKSESTEVVAAMTASTKNAVAMLPQPYVTTLQMQNDKVNIALDITKEWSNISPDNSLVTGVTVARKDFIQQNEDAFLEFLQDAGDSSAYASEGVDKTAELVVKYEIIPKLPIAQKAIPKCNIVFITGADMAHNVQSYLNVLFQSDAKSVGGKLPDEDFYYYRAKG